MATVGSKIPYFEWSGNSFPLLRRGGSRRLSESGTSLPAVQAELNGSALPLGLGVLFPAGLRQARNKALVLSPVAVAGLLCGTCLIQLPLVMLQVIEQPGNPRLPAVWGLSSPGKGPGFIAGQAPIRENKQSRFFGAGIKRAANWVYGS